MTTCERETHCVTTYYKDQCGRYIGQWTSASLILSLDGAKLKGKNLDKLGSFLTVILYVF